jgi:hydrogenase nickel incorporation protein HypB
VKIIAAEKILKANDQLAEENRAKFNELDVFCVNVVGSPGAGKTTLLEALIGELEGRVRSAVIEGDIAGSIDAKRIEKLGIPVVQINTQGACHLDAAMLASATEDLDFDAIDLLFIENVGNLVCTAGFDLGEHLRTIVLSMAEGDDKAAKYPAIFQGSQALVVTKADLAAHTNFNIERIGADMKRLAPEAPIFQVAALTGVDVSPIAEWLVAQSATVDSDA